MAEIVIKLVNGELAGKTMQEINKSVRDSAKELSKAKVGTEEWVKAHQKLDSAKKLQGDLNTQINATSKASTVLKGAFGGVLNQIPGFSSLAGVLGQVRGGVGGLTSGFGTLRGAVMASGFGLLLIALTALIGAFSRFTPLIDKVEQILGGISAVMSELIQRIQTFGSGIWDIITGAPGGFDKVKKSVDGVTESMENAYNAGTQLKKLQQDLEDSARGIEIGNVRAEKQVEKLIIMSKNKALSDKEQIKILQDARKIADENFKKEEAFRQKQFDALIMEAQTKSKLSKDEIIQLTEGTLAQEIEYEKRGDLGDDLLDKIKESFIERINAEGQAGKLSEKIQNAESARLEQLDSDRKKAVDDEKKRQDELSKATEERLQKELEARQNTEDLKIQVIDDAMTREIEKVHLDTERKIEALVGSEEQILEQEKLLKEVELSELAAIEDKYALAAAEKDKKAKAEQSKRDQEAADEKIRISKAIADAEEATAEIRLDTARSTTAGLGELLSSQIKNEKAARAVRKGFAIADIAMGLIQEVTANSAAAAKIAAQAPPYTIPAGAAYLAAANARSIIRAAVATAKVLLFRRGGLLRGPSHEQGGIPGMIKGSGQPIEMEGDEFIFSSKAVKGIGAQNLMRINNHFNNKKFATGGPVSPFSDRPAMTSSSSSSSSSLGLGADVGKMLEAQDRRIQQLIEAQDRRIDRIKVINVATETEKVIKTINQIKEEADV